MGRGDPQRKARYEDRRREAGQVKVTVWVHETRRQELHQMAERMQSKGD